MDNEKVVETRIRNKHDTDANFTTNNPVLLDGEIVFVMGSNGEIQMKVGDGTSNYVALPFIKLKSIEMTGTPVAPTASQSSNNTQVANTAFVYNEIKNNINLSVDSNGILSLSLYE